MSNLIIWASIAVIYILIVVGVFAVSYVEEPAQASQYQQVHESQNLSQQDFIEISEHKSRVEITTDHSYRYIKSDGIPDHETGRFPNRGNPHTISSQQHNFRMPLNPEFHWKPKFERGYIFGVALNGIPFDPGTAEFYNNDPRSGWNIEAITGNRNLGLDQNSAHVQPDGTYHYHGIPWTLIKLKPKTEGIVHIGYAADGHKIYMPGAQGKGLEPSYRIKKGTRASGPGGKYDGTYTQDWEYIEDYGPLDECNGTTVDGEYVYVLTETFPFVPRCFKGTPDPSFKKHQGGPSGQRRGPPGHHHRHPPRRH